MRRQQRHSQRQNHIVNFPLRLTIEFVSCMRQEKDETIRAQMTCNTENHRAKLSTRK